MMITLETIKPDQVSRLFSNLTRSDVPERIPEFAGMSQDRFRYLCLDNPDLRRTRFKYGIYKDSRHPLGVVDLFNIQADHSWAEIGMYLVSSADRNRGIGGLVLSEILFFAKYVRHVNVIHCNCLKSNPRAIAFFRKHGFAPLAAPAPRDEYVRFTLTL